MAGGLAACLAASGADLRVKLNDVAPPAELGESISKSLDRMAVQVLDGDKPVLELWFRAPLPVKGKPQSETKALDSVNEMTLLGAAKVGAGQRDYKDNEILEGLYTIHFGLQPQDGDHLGTAEYPYFAVLVPAKSDPELTALKTYKAMVKASAKATTSGHPCVLSMRPSAAGNGVVLTKPAAEHEAVRITLPIQGPDCGPESKITFELVLKGKYKS